MRYSYKDIHRLVTEAYLDSRKNERGTNTQLGFELNLEDNLANLAYSLYNRTWKPQAMDWFVIDFPTVREVFSSKAPDSVVSHVVYNLLYPVFERYFIFDSYSCRLGKGTLQGIERFEHHLRSGSLNYAREVFILNLDISGYFMSINRAKLYDIIWETLSKYRESHPEAMDYDFADYVISALVFRDPTEGCVFVGDPRLVSRVPAKRSLFGRKPGIGIPIGDVNNQLNSNIYLNPFDQFVKRTLKMKHYCRYVDDARLIHHDWSRLLECKEICGEYLDKVLGLSLHPTKTTITSSNDVNFFLGAAIKPFRRHARSDSISRFKEYIKVLDSGDFNPVTERQNLNSRLGYFSHFNEWKAVSKAVRSSNLPLLYDFNDNYTYARIKT